MVENWLNDLPPLRKPRQTKPKRQPVPEWVKKRYFEAHKKGFNQVAKDAGHYFTPVFPATTKANGLTQAIVKFLLWEGHRATRVSSSGRMIAGKYIPGTTRKGAADISATIKGRSVMLEVKVGSDKPSEYQLREQELERKAGGIYEFVKTFEEFLVIYDKIIL